MHTMFSGNRKLSLLYALLAPKGPIAAKGLYKGGGVIVFYSCVAGHGATIKTRTIPGGLSGGPMFSGKTKLG